MYIYKTYSDVYVFINIISKIQILININPHVSCENRDAYIN